MSCGGGLLNGLRDRREFAGRNVAEELQRDMYPFRRHPLDGVSTGFQPSLQARQLFLEFLGQLDGDE